MYPIKTIISYPITFEQDSDMIRKTLYLTIDDDMDDVIEDKLLAAIAATESEINQDIAYKNNVLNIKKFKGKCFYIPEGNFNSMTSIVNNDTSTLITSYDIEKGYSYFKVDFDDFIDCESITFNFTTGFINKSDVDPLLRTAVLVKATDLLSNERDSYNRNTKNETWEKLCKPFKLL